MINLSPIERRDNLSVRVFYQEFVKPSKPVIITDFSARWPARYKWTYDYLKKVAGDIEVPLFQEAFADQGSAYMKAEKIMLFRDYLNLLAHSETKLRMFLFNIHKKMPLLCQDFDYPEICQRYLKKFPFLFFGQKGAHVDVHYDADLSHVFLTQFAGDKRVILFHPKDTRLLYRHPFTVSTNVDLSKPDFVKYPHLLKANGFECLLKHGETLFMPSGYWHYIEYTDTGFSLSLRAQPDVATRRLHGYMNIFNLVIMDYVLGKVFQHKRWYAMKERLAVKRAEKYVNATM